MPIVGEANATKALGRAERTAIALGAAELGRAKGDERTLVVRPHVVQCDAAAARRRGEDEALRIEGHRRTAIAGREAHHALAVGRTQVPYACGAVHRCRREDILLGRHLQRHELVSVRTEVAQVAVLVE